MQEKYSLKVQAIRSKKQRPRLYVYMPHALVEAIGLEAGEEVSWEILDRGELHLVRAKIPPVRARDRARRSKR